MPTFTVGDLDVTQFVVSWLDGLDRNELFQRQAADSPDVAPFFMMANITPLVGRTDAGADELVLYAVLAAFQGANFPGRPESAWVGPAPHLDAAFAYANALGRTDVAKALLLPWVRRAFEEPDRFDTFLRSRSLDDPGKTAAHEQEMADIRSRDIRAAAVLDPRVNLDDMLLHPEPE